MTSQPQPTSGEVRSASQYLRPLRDNAAYVLLGATAVLLFVAIVRLIPSGVGLDFGTRAQDSFYSLINLATILFPLGAVLLSLYVTPQHPNVRLVTIVALVEYAVAAVFGVIFGFLVALIKIVSVNARSAFEELLVRGAWLAVFAFAGYATFQIWRHLFYVPKPKPQPGVYGQPQYGGPGYPPPGYPPPGYGQPGQPAYGGRPPAYPGTPQGTPPPGLWGQPPVSAQPGPHSAPPGPHSAPPGPFAPEPGQFNPYPPEPSPYGTAPTYPPASTPPGYVGFTDPTQMVPRHEEQPPADDRTEIVRDPRPGYGPADHDPPRY